MSVNEANCAADNEMAIAEKAESILGKNVL
jgi:hypothetical protein